MDNYRNLRGHRCPFGDTDRHEHHGDGKPFPAQKGLSKIYHKSDFSVLLSDPTGDEETPFILTFYVGDLETTYTAGFDGTDYKRCKRLEDGNVEVFFNRHALPCGRLMLRVEIDRANFDYEDGELNTFDKIPLSIILYDGPTSYDSTMVYALAPYIVGKNGKDGEDGEDGTSFTYENLTEEQKEDLGKAATKTLAETAIRSYTVDNAEKMAAIEKPKEGDSCTLATAEINASDIKAGDVINKIIAIDAAKMPTFADYLLSKSIIFTGFWYDYFDNQIMQFYYPETGTGVRMFADGAGDMPWKAWNDETAVAEFINKFNAISSDERRTVKHVGITGSGMPVEIESIGGESPVTLEVQRKSFYTFHNGEWVPAITEKRVDEILEKLTESSQKTYSSDSEIDLKAIPNPKEGDLCSCLADSSVRDNLANVKAGDVITKIVSISQNPQDIADYISALDSVMPSSVYGYYNSEGKDIITYRPGCNMTVGDETISSSEFAQYKNGAVVSLFNSLPEGKRKVAKISGITDVNAASGSVIESPVIVEVRRSNVFVYHKGAWTLQEEKAGKATTPFIYSAEDVPAMKAISEAKDGDRCITNGTAIYDRVNGGWYFTAGVQPAHAVKASELKAGDKIKAVNFDTTQTPVGTGDGVFCTIGGIPIEMLAFIDSVSYGKAKTPLFTGAWNAANAAACSTEMAGKTVDSVAANMAALSANVDDWVSFVVE